MVLCPASGPSVNHSLHDLVQYLKIWRDAALVLHLLTGSDWL